MAAPPNDSACLQAGSALPADEGHNHLVLCALDGRDAEHLGAALQTLGERESGTARRASATAPSIAFGAPYCAAYTCSPTGWQVPWVQPIAHELYQPAPFAVFGPPELSAGRRGAA